MSTAVDHGHPARWIYITAAVLLVVFAVIAVLTFDEIHQNNEANAKAEQLHSNLLAAGLPAPEPDVIASALGDNGGSVCQDPDAAHIKAKYQAALTNGAAGPGQRPVIGSREAAEAVGQAIAVYCPEHLADYRAHLDSLNLDDTTK
ncbi:hypothetical protein [Nocardia caishijiensis]|uniref:DUF732 domain-containing protein n=1 Tax=Nocardia caishijiensis TaxID=184756 RepID=A0ABQ6YR51_9NOCA|nr:hypothetical protein [Nocardia caishijiensis]KAF0847976.1 hypothetical protein FNL39_102117 [Nocardia caishijiensis]